MAEQQEFERYEEVARYLIEQFGEHFGLNIVEGKQILEGRVNNWEIDAKGIRITDGAIVIVECKQKRTRKVEAPDVSHLAYRIKDTGAAGGIIVSPLGLQPTAQAIADDEGLVTATLSPDSTTTHYVMRFLQQIKAGVFVDSIEIGSAGIVSGYLGPPKS